MRITPSFISVLENLLAGAGPDVLWDKRLSALLADHTCGAYTDEAALFLLGIDAGLHTVMRQNPALRNDAPFMKKQINRLCREYLLAEDAASAVVHILRLSIHKDAVADIFAEPDFGLRRMKRPPDSAYAPLRFLRFDGGQYLGLDNQSYLLSPFCIMDRPLNQDEYWNITHDNPSYNPGGALPVDGVSWYMAVDFCETKNRTGKKQGTYTIEKNIPDPANDNPLDNLRWKVEWNKKSDGFRLPAAAEWEAAYKADKTFKVDSALMEWVFDKSPSDHGCPYRIAYAIYKPAKNGKSLTRAERMQKNRGIETLKGAPAFGHGICGNVNKNRNNYGKKCFSYAGAYTFRLAMNGADAGNCGGIHG